jgi:hypothetical protein
MPYDEIKSAISKCAGRYRSEKLAGEFGKNARFELMYNKLTERLGDVIMHTQQALMSTSFVPDRYELDLGGVCNMAEVTLNGTKLRTLWRAPFRIDVTGALKPGMNKLEISVTNLWPNRLIGDEQPGVKQRITYTTWPFYKAGDPLLVSGLLGPVKILSD